MTGITDLAVLLRDMQPALRGGEYVYCTLPRDDARDLAGLHPLGTFLEDEGLTLILDRATADREGLSCSAPMRCITLTVHSALEAVGLTAAVSAALTRHGISANVVAAFYHDHIFVPAADADRAMVALADVTPV